MICVVLGAGAIGAENGPSPAPARPKLLGQLRAGPMAGVTDLVFAVRKDERHGGHNSRDNQGGADRPVISRPCSSISADFGRDAGLSPRSLVLRLPLPRNPPEMDSSPAAAHAATVWPARARPSLRVVLTLLL
jgi:hypothetical protein